MFLVVLGGLGNQMFQYALYLTLKAQGCNVKLDTSMYSYIKMHNGYELDRCFGLSDKLVQKNKIHLFFLRFVLKVRPKILVYEDLLYYDNNVYKSNKKYLIGYWQSEKYFSQIKDIIKTTYVFRDIGVENQILVNEIKKCESISLHLRKGDYLNNDLYSNICTPEYYSKAIEYLISNISSKQNIKFYIFSDDNVYANEFINKLDYPAKLIDNNKGENSYKDMYLMSQCKHNIIANSSFSWWGAWLNSNPDKVVVAPNRWFNKDNEDSYKDIVPKNWIKI